VQSIDLNIKLIHFFNLADQKEIIYLVPYILKYIQLDMSPWLVWTTI